MEGILNQRRAIQVLQAQLGSGRMHHGYIFHGPSGVGKFTTAVALAKVLLCHQPTTTPQTGEREACGECESCALFHARADDDDPSNAVENGRSTMSIAHPDLHGVAKELAHYSDDPKTRDRKLRTIPVDVIRHALIDPAHLAPVQGGGRYGKVFIVDEAELMAGSGQNALLKTLEEPPRAGGGTTIILVTANEERLLPTIRSRCQRIAFTRLDDETVDHWLNKVGGAGGQRLLDGATRKWLVRFAEGSLGRAELALSYGLDEWSQTILPAIERMSQGRPVGELGGELASMINDFATTWVHRHRGASKEAANQLGAALCLGIIASEARRRLAHAVEQAAKGEPGEGEAAAKPWLGVIDAIDQAEANMRANVNLSLSCDHLALMMGRSLSGASISSPP